MSQQQIFDTSANNKDIQLKYKINYLKLKRISELNQNLKKELTRERITSSNASLQIINYTNDVFLGKDYTVPSVYGYPPPGANPLNKVRNNHFMQEKRNEYSTEKGCCTIM
ncbi:hypothetical protein QEN19_003300 [Hanseniaspora menglaensis]